MEHKQFLELKEMTEAQLKRIAEEAGTSVAELKLRVLELEQKGATRGAGTDSIGHDSPGAIFTNSDQYRVALQKSNPREVDAVLVKRFDFGTKAAIVTQGQVLSPAMRLDRIVAAPGVVGAVRDLLPIAPTGQNSIEFAKEVVGSNTDWEAAPQYSSPNRENVAKKELKVEFTLVQEPVQTLAGWIPASRQVLSDSGALAGFINGRLLLGVKSQEEHQLLNGSGTGGDLNGLVTQATAYAGGATGDSRIDTLMRAVSQIAAAGYTADGIVMSHADALALLLTKDQEDRYLLRDLSELASKTGCRIALSQRMNEGDFLVGAFQQGATLFDREQATVRIAEQHSDFFVKNMIVLLGEERLALVVYDSTTLVSGSF